MTTKISFSVLTTYTQWHRLGVGEDQDEIFAKEFLDAAMKIYTKVLKYQSSVTAQEKAQFSVLPKKVRHVSIKKCSGKKFALFAVVLLDIFFKNLI